MNSRCGIFREMKITEKPEMIFMGDTKSHLHFESDVTMYSPVILSKVFVKNPKTGEFGHYCALWDTGATNSSVGADIVEALSLEQCGMKEMLQADCSCAVYNAFFSSFSDSKDGRFLNVKTTCLPMPNEYSVIIGMDIISQGDFRIVREGNHLHFTFDI